MIDFLKDILYSLRHAAKERLVNPFVGSFIGFLLLINWRVPVIVLLGDGTIRDRMQLVDAYRQDDYWIIYGLPVLLAGLYVLAMPYVSLWIHRWQSKPRHEQKRAKIDWDLKLAEARTKLAQVEIERENAREAATMQLSERRSGLEFKRMDIQNRHEIEKLTVTERVQNQVLSAENHALESRVRELQNDKRDLESRHSGALKEISRDRDRAIADLNTSRGNETQHKAETATLRSKVNHLENQERQLQQQLRQALLKVERLEVQLQAKHKELRGEIKSPE